MCRGGFRRAHTPRSGPVAVSKPLLGPATASAVAGGVGSRGAHCRAVVCNCRPRARQRCRASRYLTSRKPFPAYSARYVPSRALPLNCVVTSPRAVMRTNRPTVLLELFEFVRDPEFSNLTRTTPVTAFAKAAPLSTSSSRYSPSSCLRANQLERKEREVKETLPRRRLLSSNFRGIPRSRRCCRLVLAATVQSVATLMGGTAGSLSWRLKGWPDSRFLCSNLTR